MAKPSLSLSLAGEMNSSVGHYSNQANRQISIESFWHSRYLPADELAQSGFYAPLDGAPGTLVCHRCGLRVSNWHLHSSAWVPHALYSPNCPHLLEQVRPQFVGQIISTALSLYQLDAGLVRRLLGDSVVLPVSSADIVEWLRRSVQAGDIRFQQQQQQQSRLPVNAIDSQTPTQVTDQVCCQVSSAPSLPKFEHDEPKLPPRPCAICLEAPQQMVLIPCGHLCCCRACYQQSEEIRQTCPICRTPCTSAVMISR